MTEEKSNESTPPFDQANEGSESLKNESVSSLQGSSTRENESRECLQGNIVDQCEETPSNNAENGLSSSASIDERPPVDVKEKKNKKLAIIIASVVAVIVIVVGVVVAMSVNERNTYNSYVDDLNATASMILSSAAECETLGNDVKQIWNSAIWDKNIGDWDEKYQKYYATDFNTALANYFSDSAVITTVAMVESERDDIDASMKRLENPPAGCEKAFDALEELYESYSDFARLATNPSGSLQTFSNEFGTLDSETVSLYEKAVRKIPEKK